MGVNGSFVSACSGSVIAPRVILTAGHCVTGFNDFIVKTPFAGNQQVRSRRGLVLDYTSTSRNVDPNQHDVGLIVLDTPINLQRFPTIATRKVADGTQVVNIGRIQNGAFSNTALFVSQPIAVQDASNIGFRFDYRAVERIESGDSGGPDMVAGTHTIVAVNSGGGNGFEVLARVDLVTDFIRRTVDANGGGAIFEGDAAQPGGAAPTPAPEPEQPVAGREVEPNNSFDRANPLNGSLAGSLAGSDQDWFTFSLGQGAPVNLTLTPTGDAQIALFAQINGQFFQFALNDPTRVSGSLNTSATYFAAVFSPSGQSQSYSFTRR